VLTSQRHRRVHVLIVRGWLNGEVKGPLIVAYNVVVVFRFASLSSSHGRALSMVKSSILMGLA